MLSAWTGCKTFDMDIRYGHLVWAMLFLISFHSIQPAPNRSNLIKDSKESKSTNTKGTGKGNVKAKVTNKLPVTMDTLPWQVAIYTLLGDEYTFRCGGSLIAADAVLTAAHCVRNPDSSPAEVKIVAGDRNRSVVDVGEQTRNVSDVVVHPDYSGTLISVYSDDIALLKLTSGVTSSEHVSPVQWASDDHAVSSQSECLISGWGISLKKDKIPLLSSLLSAASVTMVTNEDCNRRRYWDGLIKPSQMCAYNKKVSACLGDSGGALVCKVDGSYIQYGITSWGTKSCDKKPSVFSRVSAYSHWIQATMAHFRT